MSKISRYIWNSHKFSYTKEGLKWFLSYAFFVSVAFLISFGLGWIHYSLGIIFMVSYMVVSFYLMFKRNHKYCRAQEALYQRKLRQRQNND